jgi:phosphatidylserine/phosphatidylglycerophosphate/cardiolipin synthase-like enzyme
MVRPISLAGPAILLTVLACASFPLKPGSATGTPSAVEAATATPGILSTVPPADSVSPISMHVGYGMRGSWFDVYFTDPASPAASQASGGVDDRLVEAIDSARLSVHVAVFNLTLNDVRRALIGAHRRGVEVLVVTESDNLDGENFQRLMEAGVPVLGDRREGTMHNKFMVLDGAEVWTGSMNFTVSGTYFDNNAIMRIRSAELAASYEEEFAEMYVDDRFGEESGRGAPNPRMSIEGSSVEVYFSPDDGVESVIVDLLDSAKESVDFLAFSFTSNPLGDAVRRADQAGLDVRGVLDEDQGASNLGTELTMFQSEDLDVRLDGNPGQMHEKVFVVDGEVVVLGSYNFSRNANETNDENVLIIRNRTIAEEFVREFERIYSLATP